MRDNSHSTGYSLSYTYDHNHNRTSKTLNGVATTYAYDAHDKLTSAGSKTYGYDLNGNCTSVTVGSSITSLTYDVENRVTQITYPGGATNTFAYNGEDLRTKKVDSGGTKNYVTDGASPASAVLSDGAATYTPGLSERRGTASKFYHADALGSTRGITDSTQATTDAQVYDAFGMTVSRTGTTPTPFGFVGKAQYQTDGDSGLQLLGHRYYDPSIGRFLSSDPAHEGTNWYAYCHNNPLTHIDPNGHCPLLLVLILVAVLVPILGGDGIHRDPLPPGATGPTPVGAAGPAMRPVASDNHEHGGWIYPNPGGGYVAVEAGRAGHDTGGDIFTFDPPQFGYDPVGQWHTHPPGAGHGSDYGDQNLADVLRIPEYAADPNGDIIVNNPRPGHENDPYPSNPHDPYNGPGVSIGGRWR